MHLLHIKKALIFIVIGWLGFSSCTPTRKYIYFTDLPDSVITKKTQEAVYVEPKIQVDDILSIPIQTTDPTATATLNLPSSTGFSPSGQSVISGYLVNKDGDIEMQILGKIHVLDLTTAQASELILSKATAYFKLPTVQVRFANYRINVLGDVNRPGTYIVPNEKVSIIDAISLAGDLTLNGKRDNILLVRDNNGFKEYARLNMNSSDIFKSPYFYLRQNDILYIEPNKVKISNSNDGPTVRNVTLAVTVLSLISLLIIRFK